MGVAHVFRTELQWEGETAVLGYRIKEFFSFILYKYPSSESLSHWSLLLLVRTRENGLP